MNRNWSDRPWNLSVQGEKCELTSVSVPSLIKFCLTQKWLIPGVS